METSVFDGDFYGMFKDVIFMNVARANLSRFISKVYQTSCEFIRRREKKKKLPRPDGTSRL